MSLFTLDRYLNTYDKTLPSWPTKFEKWEHEMKQEFTIEVGIAERLSIYKTLRPVETPAADDDDIQPSNENEEVYI